MLVALTGDSGSKAGHGSARADGSGGTLGMAVEGGGGGGMNGIPGGSGPATGPMGAA